MKKPDGGPSAYYDFKGKYKTVNDILEDKGETQWEEHSWHLSNIFKATWRWGSKDGTTKEYDAKKIIYSGCRILRKMVGTQALRDYLQSLLDDPQFQEDEVEYERPIETDKSIWVDHDYKSALTEEIESEMAIKKSWDEVREKAINELRDRNDGAYYLHDGIVFVRDGPYIIGHSGNVALYLHHFNGVEMPKYYWKKTL